MLTALGLPSTIARLGPLFVGGMAVIAGVLLRSRPRASFAAFAAGAVLATPVIRADTLGLLATCLAPWATAGMRAVDGGAADDLRQAAVSGWLPGSPGARRAAASLAVLAMIGIGLAHASTAPTGAVWLQNDTDGAAIVRFQVRIGSASFGYQVPPHAAGWAYRGQPGGTDAIVIAYDGDCAAMSRTSLSVTTLAVTITEHEVELQPEVGATASATGPYLAYTHTCAGR